MMKGDVGPRWEMEEEAELGEHFLKAGVVGDLGLSCLL